MRTASDFKLKLTGDTADAHQFQSYDGYMSLAGFAWTLALITNYVETGEIRQRGQFIGRQLVSSSPISQGSIVAEFVALASSEWVRSTGLVSLTAGSSVILLGIVRRIIARNLGQHDDLDAGPLGDFLRKRNGEIEALVAHTEPSIKQCHRVINNGANKIQIIGGHNVINTFSPSTKNYVNGSIVDSKIYQRNVSVASFNVNSGTGSVFDFELGRVITVKIPNQRLSEFRSVFSWGLDQYANRTGGVVFISFTRILALDHTPKVYEIVSAIRNS